MLGKKIMNTNIHLNAFVYVYVLKEFPCYVYFYMYIVMNSLLFTKCIDLSQLEIVLETNIHYAYFTSYKFILYILRYMRVPCSYILQSNL